MIVDWLSFGALLIYSFLTYLMTKDIYNPLISFGLKQIPLSPTSLSPSHLGFNMVNKSKVEIEVFGKLWCRIGKELFDFKDGFYGNKKHWILQSSMEGFGHFDLKNLTNKDGINLENFLENNKLGIIRFKLQLKYRGIIIRNRIYNKIVPKKWKITSPQTFAYNFEDNQFWLDV